MLKPTLDDTIAAISTPVGRGGIGIIRLSGKEAVAIADKIFMAKDGRKPSSYKTYTVHYGWIKNRTQNSELRTKKKQNPSSGVPHLSSEGIIDEVLLTVMRAPGSYTKEDIVEISCHSGMVALREILDLVLSSGARLSEPGEFTKRAFLNGRIDLSRAEAVLDIINAKTGLALESGIKQLEGSLAREVNRIKERLGQAIVLLEANIDFPDEEIAAADKKRIEKIINNTAKNIQDLLSSAKHGKVLREGISAVILGRANVGKSSLLNALLKEERSIVSPIAGTTRDAIEEILDIQGIPLKIADTAGIIEPKDLIEKEALKRTQNYFAKANLVLLVFDAGESISPEDKILIEKSQSKTVIAVLNKCDRKIRIDEKFLKKHFTGMVKISALKQKGLKDLEAGIVKLAWEGRIESGEEVLVANSRHIQALKNSREALEAAGNSVKENLSLEFISEDLKNCQRHLGGITGETIEEDILDKIFSEFCVGK